MAANNISKGKHLNVLALEDSARDFDLTKEQLIAAGYILSIARVETEKEYTASLRTNLYDIILADFKLPGFDAFGALRVRNEICPETPFICVSGSIGEETAIELLKSGAVDYVIKDRPERLPFAIGRALGEVQEKILLNQNDDALKEAYHQLKASQSMLQETMDGIIRVLGQTVEVRDPYTAGHQRRVAKLASAMAEKLGLSQDMIRGVRMAGEIHDLGKISLPAEILSKPTKLTSLEFGMIKLHPQTGYDILKGIDFSWPIAEQVYQHHERMDGSGYPRGLKGNEILLGARILAVADVVEAMNSHRPYRPALGLDKALAEIEMNRGVLYDSEVADACLWLLKVGNYQLDDN
jgi:response regulator RpfG family c-di-GMP phosphodiesterase